MPEGNVQIVRRAYAALAERGVEAILAFADPEIEVTTPAALASEPDTYRRHDGVRRWFASIGDAMDEVYLEWLDFEAVGDEVLVETNLHARGRTTGIETAQRAFVVWTLRGGLVTRAQAFADRAQARQAAER